MPPCEHLSALTFAYHNWCGLQWSELYILHIHKFGSGHVPKYALVQMSVVILPMSEMGEHFLMVIVTQYNMSA